jgi:hypothetical protein
MRVLGQFGLFDTILDQNRGLQSDFELTTSICL